MENNEAPKISPVGLIQIALCLAAASYAIYILSK